MSLSDTQLTNKFIKAGVPRDGHLYSYARKLMMNSHIDATSQKIRAYMGFSSLSLFAAYTFKLEAAGLAKINYDREGNILSVEYTEGNK